MNIIIGLIGVAIFIGVFYMIIKGNKKSTPSSGGGWGGGDAGNGGNDGGLDGTRPSDNPTRLI